MRSCLLILVLTVAAAAHGEERARLAGTLWWLTPEDAHRPVAAWQGDLDALQALGMKMMILNGPFVGEDLPAGQADPMAAFFEEAARRGLDLYIDTLQAPNWWTLTDPGAEIARASAHIRLIQERYGRYASFKGWYVPYELYVFWDKQADLIRTLYREVAACCKRAAPDRPVVISPFFILDEAHKLGDFRWASPAEYQAFWTETLKQAPVDIVALQDSGEHLACYTFEERRPFFQAMKAACDAAGKTLWANVETGELDVKSVDDYVARFGLKTHVNDPKTAPYWRGVPAEKLRDKLRFVRAYTPTAITWGYREYVRPSLGPSARQLHDEYRAILGK